MNSVSEQEIDQAVFRALTRFRRWERTGPWKYHPITGETAPAGELWIKIYAPGQGHAIMPYPKEAGWVALDEEVGR